nr:hypothetical protein HUO10_003948 [Paraburkholderia busanensis]
MSSVATTVQARRQNLVSSSIAGLALNVFVPTCRIDLADQHTEHAHARHGSLEGLGHAHHSILLSMNRGSRVATMNAQADWRKRLAAAREDAGTIFVEHEMPLGDMVSRAAEPLLGRLAPAGNLVINCQSTRESVFGSSNAGRILSEASRSGLGFTIGQRGLVGGLQALEAVLVLGRNARFSGSALVCAGDRWIDIYPRILGDWAMLSDGAAAAAFTLTDGIQANVWVINDRVSCHPLDSGAARERVVPRLHEELVERLSSFVERVQMQRAGSLAIASPRICGTLGEDVEASLAARHPFIVAGAPNERPHFGAANVLINLHRSVERHRHAHGHETEVAMRAPQGYLVWDCDPSGLFGAVIVEQSAFDTVN